MKKRFIEIWGEKVKFLDYYEKNYLDIIKKYDLEVLLYSTDYNIEDFKRKEELEKKGIFLLKYSDEKDLLNKIKNIDNIQYINTFTENLIILTNKIKKELGQKVTDNFELFRNKKLQRELLLNYDKDITVNYLEKKLGELNFEKLKKEFGLPFILKPKDGVESSGVAKIENLNDFENYKNNNNLEIEILVEEFIDGQMYTISEYINEKGNIIYTPLVEVKTGNDIGIDDFFLFSRSITQKNISSFDNKKIKDFVENSIKACKIKNTFIHHEFKLTTKGKLKTIELNGRIGGYRLEMYKEAFDYNLFDGIFGIKSNNNLLYNISSIAIYPEKKSKLISYNYELLEEIKKLKSFFSLRILPEKYEGKHIGLTKDGFGKVGGIKLKNSNYEQFQKDYDFIEKNYKKLLILD